MTEDNELIEHMAEAIRTAAWDKHDEHLPIDAALDLARAALTAYCNHQVEL